MERLSLKVLNNVLNVMETIRDCCGGFGDSLEECKYEFLKQHKRFLELKEQGRLPELPCAVGDKLYEPRPDRGIVTEYVASYIGYAGDNYEIFVGWRLNSGIYSNLDGVSADKIGKTVFLTLEEAEKVMERMKDEV